MLSVKEGLLSAARFSAPAADASWDIKAVSGDAAAAFRKRDDGCEKPFAEGVAQSTAVFRPTGPFGGSTGNFCTDRIRTVYTAKGDADMDHIIELKDITVSFDGETVLDHLDLNIGNGEFVTLLGPSGCGKTTTLRMIAGLETPTSGRITIGDTVVFDSDLGINVPANKRRVGFLFQNYALWPNMTVYENISFGLSNVKEPMAKIDFEAKNAARLAEILKTPAEVVSVLEECRDKDGKLEEKKAVLKLIDAFTISQYTAKKLFDYHLETKQDCHAEIAALEAKAEAAHKTAQASGCTLDAEYRYCRDGEAVMQTRKLTKEEIDLTVRRVSRIVKIGMFMDRYPAELLQQLRQF